MKIHFELRCTWAWKRKEENYIEFLYIKLYITIGWRGSVIGASKNRLGACYARERDRAPFPPRTDIPLQKKNIIFWILTLKNVQVQIFRLFPPLEQVF